MKKLLFLLCLAPTLSYADRLGSLNSAADVLLSSQAVAGSGTTIYSATSTANFPYGADHSTVTIHQTNTGSVDAMVITSTGTGTPFTVIPQGWVSGGYQNQKGAVTIGDSNPNRQFSTLLVLVDSTTDQQLGGGILEIWSRNPLHNDPIFWLHSASHASGPDMRIDSNAMNVELVNNSTDNAHGLGKWEYAEAYQGIDLQINNRAYDNTTFETLAYFHPLSKIDIMPGLYLNPQNSSNDGGIVTSSGTSGIHFFTRNNHSVGLTGAPETTATWVNALPDTSGSGGNIMYHGGNVADGSFTVRQWKWSNSDFNYGATTGVSASTLTINNQMSGAGLTNCGDSSHAVSWNSTTKQFGCQAITGGTGGDVFLASTQTFSGSNTFAGPLVVNSTRTTFTPVGDFGVTITSSAATTSAAFMFDVSQSTSNGLVVFDNSTKNQGGGDLFTLISTNTNNHSFNMRIYRNSPGNSNGDIRVDSPNPNFEFIDTTQDGGTSAWGKYEIPSINNDHCNITGRNAANTSFQNIAGFNRIEGANGGGLVLYSTCSIKFSNTVGSYVGFRPGNTFTDSGSIIWTLPLTFNNTGQVMTQISNQPDYQLAFSTGGASGQFMAWNGSGGPVWATPPSSGGGGSSTLAVGTGTASNFTTQVTSPTASLSFDGTEFHSSALGTTNYVTIYSIPAADVASGSLGASVIASSIAANAVQDASIVGVAGSKITGTASIPNAAIDGSSITKQGLFVAGSNITLTPSGGQTTIAATSSGGYAVEPATVTFQLTQGILASTIAFSGPIYPVVQQQVSNGAGLCQINNGCIPSGQFETTNSSQDYTAVIFQAGTTEYWQWGMRLPLNFVTTSTFTIRVTQTSTATATASWKADMVCIGKGASIDQAFGTAVSFSTTSTAGTFLVSQESPAITPAGSCSNGAWAKLRVYRNGDPVSDVYMTEVDVYYEENNISEH